jgi:hypothetical protein
MLPQDNRPSIALDPPSIIPLITLATLQPLSLLSVYRQALDRHVAFTNASSPLATALLDSISDNNRTQIESSFHPLPLYAITPAQIVDTMITLYGVATGTDLQRLREPLLEHLTALADLEPFMAKFKLNTLKLTTSGYGKSPY